MAWNTCYWDLAKNFYWEPRLIGLKSIPKSSWITDSDWVRLPAQAVNKDASIYTRRHKEGALVEVLRRQELTLNHIFNVTFAIAPDAVLREAFFSPFGFEDDGPVESVGREIWRRYGWNSGENATQQDGLFVTSRVAIGVELKLGAKSSLDQVLKYAAILTWEELYSGRKNNLGLLYILPAKAIPAHWMNCGLTGPNVTAEFMTPSLQQLLPGRIRTLIDEHRLHCSSVLDRMRLAVISWSDLQHRLDAIRRSLSCDDLRDQTLDRLLQGFLDQLKAHVGTDL